MTDRDSSELVLYGRSSSHFTRVVRMFAAELGVSYSFRVVRRLLSLEAADYGDNPALKLPSLRDADGLWFGALVLCRRLVRGAGSERRVIWPEDLHAPLASNAQELAVQAMATGVSLILSEANGPSAHRTKQLTSLRGSLGWLDARVDDIVDQLPAERDLSFLEVTLFCMFTHLQFREVMPVDGFVQLRRFCERYGTRESAKSTAYCFDA